MTTKTNPTRRSFLAGIAAATAATALPARTIALDAPAATRTNDRHAIPGLPSETTDAIRVWYAAAVAEVAGQLRPRFESGELHGWRKGDSERMDGEKGRTYVPSPWRVENECGERFVRGSMQRAYFVLAASPSEVETFDPGSTDPRYHAAQAMAWDVIRYARAQGWTVLADGEEAPGAVPGTRRYDSGQPFRGWNRRGEV